MAEWLISFTDAELNAIYNVVETAPLRDNFEEEEALHRVMDKIIAREVGDSTPSEAVDA